MAIFTASRAQLAATMALVEGMAGMMFLTTPCVWLKVTPEMLKRSARTSACSNTHFMWSGLSGSNDSPARSWPHWMRWAYSMQWAALRGVSARVHRGNLVCGGKRSMLQWKHGVTPGTITREWPCGEGQGAQGGNPAASGPASGRRERGQLGARGQEAASAGEAGVKNDPRRGP